MKRHAAPTRTSRLGFTLPEMLAVIVVVGALSAVVAPLVLSSSDAYAGAAEQRTAVERLSASLDRVTRLFRDAPGDGAGGVGFVSAGPSRAVFNDGSSVELLGTTLWFATAGEQRALLCQRVASFRIDYIGADGVADVMAQPENTHRAKLTIESGGVELRTSVFMREARTIE